MLAPSRSDWPGFLLPGGGERAYRGGYRARIVPSNFALKFATELTRVKVAIVLSSWTRLPFDVKLTFHLTRKEEYRGAGVLPKPSIFVSVVLNRRPRRRDS